MCVGSRRWHWSGYISEDWLPETYILGQKRLSTPDVEHELFNQFHISSTQGFWNTFFSFQTAILIIRDVVLIMYFRLTWAINGTMTPWPIRILILATGDVTLKSGSIMRQNLLWNNNGTFSVTWLVGSIKKKNLWRHYFSILDGVYLKYYLNQYTVHSKPIFLSLKCYKRKFLHFTTKAYLNNR